MTNALAGLGTGLTSGLSQGLLLGYKIQQQRKTEKRQDRAQLIQIIGAFDDIAKLPKDLRGSAVDSVADIYKDITKQEMSPHLVNALKKGDDESLNTLVNGALQVVEGNPDLGAKTVLPLMGSADHRAAFNTFVKLFKYGQEAKANNALSSLNNPVPGNIEVQQVGPPSSSQAENKASFNQFAQGNTEDQLQSQIDRLMAVASHFPGTPAAKQAITMVERLQKQQEQISGRREKTLSSDFGQLAFELTGKDLNELTPNEVNQIRTFSDLLNSQKVSDETLARVATEIRVRNDKEPMTPEDLSKLRVPGQGLLPFGTTKSQATEAGAYPAPKLSTNEIKDLVTATRMSEISQDVEEIISDPKIADELGTLWQGRVDLRARKITGDLTPAEADLFAKTSFLKSRVIVLVTGAGVTGEDQKRILGEVPDPFRDNANEFRAKLKLTQKNYETLLESYADELGRPDLKPSRLRQLRGEAPPSTAKEVTDEAEIEAARETLRKALEQ